MSRDHPLNFSPIQPRWIAVGSHHTITVEEGSGGDDESTFRSEMCFSQFDPSTSGEKLFHGDCAIHTRDCLEKSIIFGL